MKLRDSLWLGSKGIRERKTRAAITILSVVVGVASIIALVWFIRVGTNHLKSHK